MQNKVLCCLIQRRKIILDNIENQISVYVKITMSNMVTHSYHIPPRDFWSIWE